VDLAAETGTPPHPWEGGTILVDRTGEVLEKGKTRRVLDRVWTILEDAVTYGRENTQNIDPSSSLMTSSSKKAKSYSKVVRLTIMSAGSSWTCLRCGVLMLETGWRGKVSNFSFWKTASREASIFAGFGYIHCSLLTFPLGIRWIGADAQGQMIAS
jgi:hypothetical protein